MAKRTNLSTNPSLKNNTTGWFGPSGYARSTSMHASMPRTTGYAGSSSGDIASPQCDVVAGQQYCTSVYVRNTSGGSTSVTLNIDWYNSSGSYLSSAGSSSFTVGATTTSLLEIGPKTAPSGAAKGLTTITVAAVALQVGGHRFEQTGSTGLAYFDGDSTSPKATWAGTAGNSVSYELTYTDPWTFTDSGSMTSVTPGPSGSDAASFSAVGSVVGSGTANEDIAFADAAMIIQIGYDERRGRVRVSAFGLPSTTTRAVVESRPHGLGRYATVRGGKVAVSAGAFSRTVDDYEFAAGEAIDYRITAYASPEGAADVITGQAYVTQAAIAPEVWLKFIANPVHNQRVTLADWGDISRPSRATFYDVIGAREPVAVTDVHGSRRVTISLRTATVAEGDALDEALSLGAPLFLHTPVTIALPSLYAVAGDFSYTRPAKSSTVRLWTLPLTEISPPPSSVVGATTTWQAILDAYPTWNDVIAAFPTWADVVS